MNNAKDISELKIMRGDLTAGILRRNNSGCEFEFAKDFLLQSSFPGISSSMPKTATLLKNSGVNLFPFFAGLLPEGLRLKALTRNLKTSEDDLFSILAATGNQTTGDVYADIGRANDKIEIPRPREINFYEFFLQTIAGDANSDDHLIAGVQEKISASMISFPLNIARKDSMYILKLNPADKPYLVENEHHCMELARKCGVEAAKTKLVKDKSGNHGLLVTRFDRTWSEEKKSFLMHHLEDACQLLDKYPAEKYRISLNNILEGIEKHVPASKVAALRLIQLYAFSYLIGNGDLHAKNISLIIKSGCGIAEIAPAYDLICTYIYGDHKMAIKLDGRDDNLKRKTFVECGERFGVSGLACNKMLDKLLADFSRHFAILDNIPMTDRQRKLIHPVIKKRIKDLS